MARRSAHAARQMTTEDGRRRTAVSGQRIAFSEQNNGGRRTDDRGLTMESRKTDIAQEKVTKREYTHFARIVLVAFLFTFFLARIVVFLIMSRRMPDLYLYLKGTHFHHLNYGIFLLSAVGAYLLFGRPAGKNLKITAGLYGIGMALTFDEFGMWIHLGGDYWQRASWDAVVVLSAGFALIAFAPSINRFRPHHWATAIILVITLILFLFLFVESFKYAGRKLGPKLRQIESVAPK